MPQAAIAALIYDAGTGGAADRLLAEITGALRREGHRLAGTIQHNSDADEGCLCDMTLEDLGSGRLVSISENRGPLARGCRLDTRALEEVVGLAGSAIDRGADLLVVNEFGKREAEGHGLRQVIEAAAGRGVPVLVAVSAANLSAWNAFTGGLDTRLSLDAKEIRAWCAEALSREAAGSGSL